MNFLLSILLYLGSISPNSSYEMAQINMYLAEQQAAISAIQQDATLSQQVQTDFGDQASLINVKDINQGE